jgi:hypothetical protein
MKGAKMAPHELSEALQQDHREILRVTEKFADALAQAANENFAARQEGLAELRTLRPGLLAISRHCCGDDAAVGTAYHRYLDGARYAQLEAQHQSIHRLAITFLRDLIYATADSIVESVPQGEELVEKIREHIAYEQDLAQRLREDIPYGEDPLDSFEELCVVNN